jgi:PAP2 superfamily
MKSFTKFLLPVLLLALLAQSCKDIKTPEEFPLANSYDSRVYHEWAKRFLEIERYAKGYRPGPCPRALGYMGLSAYECAIPGMPENNSFRNYYVGLELPTAPNGVEIHYPAAVNASYEYLMRRFFFHMENEYPDLFNSIQTTYNEMRTEYANATSPEILERSEQWGREVATAIYQWESTDTYGHNAFLDPQPTSYVAPVGPGKWYSLNGTRPMFPYWGRVRTFAITEADKLCAAPIPYSENPNSLFYTQGEEVYRVVKQIQDDPGAPGSYDLKWQGEFWSDDLLNVTFSPPARLLAIADQLVVREDLNFGTATELYAKLGMAISDNGVAIWHSKYHYNVERPDTYIRRVLTQEYPDAANWTTNLNNPLTGQINLTPAFPAYPSGHSGFGGAGSLILSTYFEYTDEHPGTYTFTDNCHLGRTDFIGTPRTFTSIAQSGEENAYSRIPLGVHFRMDCDQGLLLGRRAAQRVLELPWKK